MCDFLSFVITKDERLLVGSLFSHFGIEAGWGLKPGEYWEAEWTKDDAGGSLTVRGENSSWHRVVILSRYPTRKLFLESITGGRVEGKKYWYRNGELHRDDGPAVEWSNGSKHWYKNGERHRDGEPAVDNNDEYKEWRQNGKLHRDDGPAIDNPNGSRYWYRNGVLHRDDGPAVEYADGAKHWFQNGEPHRDDGPAVELANGDRYWYKKGKRQPKGTHNEA